MANTDAAFVGSVPELYTRYMGPMFFEPYAADLAGRLRDMASGRLLETACGTGILTRPLAAALPSSVAITATDLNVGCGGGVRAEAGEYETLVSVISGT